MLRWSADMTATRGPHGDAATWQAALARPASGAHIAQFYSEVGFLVRGVAHFVGEGLRKNDAVIVMARPVHWQAVARRLLGEGFSLERLQRCGQLTVLDAAQCLAGFVVNGMPDRERFLTSVGGAIDEANAAGYPRVRAFGEMVDLLRGASLLATLRLEELWGELLATRGITLLCGYSIDAFDPHAYRGVLQKVCAAHSGVVPVEDYPQLERAVTRAYRDVFGTDGDADALRRALLGVYPRPAAMPDAQAAMLAARELVPQTSDALLERVRTHYFGGGAPRPPDR
jgi:hypothetical protein